ncbi:MAG: T9SS type A sorting domain-containing protein, partial [Saprospiraceae bacterium]|nr:T9SS type A sorting domain-containing protein [Saprospiraceae bacterium]
GGKIRLEINIAPNPVPAYAKIKIGLPELSEPATISVFNNAGQLVQQITVDRGAPQAQLDGLSAGVYMVHVRSGDVAGSGKLLVH